MMNKMNSTKNSLYSGVTGNEMSLRLSELPNNTNHRQSTKISRFSSSKQLPLYSPSITQMNKEVEHLDSAPITEK